MKSLLSMFLVLLASFNTDAQVNFQWAQRGASIGNDLLNAAVTDADGNTYITGGYGTNGIAFGNDTLTGAVATDFYIVKYNTGGDVVWVRNAGSAGSEIGTSVALDPPGNIYVCGYTNQSGLTFGNYTLSNNGGNDVFIVKYDSSGNVLNAFSFGGSGDDRPFGITVDVSGYVFTTGLYFSPSINFGPVTITNTNTIGDAFVVKYDPAGNFLWAQSAQEASGLAIDVNNNSEAIFTGRFVGTAIPFGNDTLTSAGSNDVYIAKLNSSGNFLWAKCAGGGYDDSGDAIAIDNDGNCYVAGYFKSVTILFDNHLLINTGGNPAKSDLYLVKYDPSGNVNWAKQEGGVETEEANGLRIDADGNVLMAANMRSSFMMGNTQLNPYGGTDALVAKFDSSGNELWALNAGGTANDFGNALGIDAAGNAFIAGIYYSDPATFGPTVLQNEGGSDVYLAKVDNSLSLPEIKSNSGLIAYPVPAENNLFISSKENICKISLYTITGQLLLEAFPQKQELSVNISSYAPGMYIIRAETTKGTYTSKIIKNKVAAD